MDVEASTIFPKGIADDKPTIVIVDNDDFKIDTLTGIAKRAHRTNVMFLQPTSYEEKSGNEQPANFVKKEVSALLEEKCAELTQLQHYRCPRGSKSEPPIRPMVETPVKGTGPQRAHSVIHALSRADNNGRRPPPEEQ